jgi:deoxyribose-phosphate aldolase
MDHDLSTVEAIVRATAEAMLERLAPPDPRPRPCPACGGTGGCAVRVDRVTLTAEAATIARMVDHTLLAADATREQVRKLCEEAARYGFATVCVNSSWVREASCMLTGSGVGVCTVVGFPLGASSSDAKRFEAEVAIADGATEVDMVLAVGALKGGDDTHVRRDVATVVAAAHARGALVKVILETSLLDDEQKIRACKLSVRGGADFVKTSTGFSTGGATVADVSLMRRTVGLDAGVKASGGVRSLDDARALIAAGATRLGTSRGVAIVTGGTGGSGY